MAAGLLFSLLLGLSFGLWDGADAAQMRVANCNKCTPGWTWYDGRCFVYVNIKMSWSAAEGLCLTLNGHLVSMRSSNEYNFIRDLIYKLTGQHTRTWVGGHDSAEDNNWFWSDGSKFLFHQWGSGQPSHTGGIEHCVNINYSGQDFVDDADCNTKLPFICARVP